MKTSRRDFTRNFAAAAAAVVGFDPLGGVWVTQASAQSISIPQLDGQLLLDSGSREAAASDFGRVISRIPLAVLQPGSVSDIVKMVQFCNRFDLKIAPRGKAHTMYGQSQVSGAGITIDMKSMRTIHSISPTSARVDAGVIWRDLLIASLAQGLTPAVLTDYINLSVGGTLSVGGVGGMSYRLGTQIDNTLELEVVTGEGDFLTCSMSRNRDLFEAALGGLGQCAIIVRATIRLVPAAARARVYDLVYPTLDALMADFRLLLANERFPFMEALIPGIPGGGFAYVLECVQYYDSAPNDTTLLTGLQHVAANIIDQTYFEFCDRVTNAELGLTAIGGWSLPHPWLDMFVPGSHIGQYITGVLSELTPADVPDLPCILYGFRKSRLTRPMFRTPDEEVFSLFDILRTSDPAAVSEAVAENRTFYDRAVAIGGKFYPISAVPMSKQDWQQHFQPYYSDLRSAKSRYDRRGILTPGPGMF